MVLRHSDEIRRGEIVIVCNRKDSGVVQSFLAMADKQGILEFITIGDIEKIAKKAKRIQDEGMTFEIEKTNIPPRKEVLTTKTKILG